MLVVGKSAFQCAGASESAGALLSAQRYRCGFCHQLADSACDMYAFLQRKTSAKSRHDIYLSKIGMIGGKKRTRKLSSQDVVSSILKRGAAAVATLVAFCRTHTKALGHQTARASPKFRPIQAIVPALPAAIKAQKSLAAYLHRLALPHRSPSHWPKLARQTALLNQVPPSACTLSHLALRLPLVSGSCSQTQRRPSTPSGGAAATPAL